MPRKSGWVCLSVLVLSAALALPAAAQSGENRVKVIVEKASLHLKPSLDSAVLEENVPLGTVFEHARKTGEWYEVRYPSQLGVLITGYIHEMYVELLPAAETAPVQPVAPAPAGTVRAGGGTRPAGRRWAARPHQLEIGAFFGLGLGTQVGGGSGYSSVFPADYVLASENGDGTLSHEVKGLSGLGLSLTYYLAGGLGLQVRADFGFKKDITGGGSHFTMHWVWTDATSGTRTDDFALGGDLSLTPISLDLVYRIPAAPWLSPYLGAGVSYITGSFKADSEAGFPFWYIDGAFQNVDYVAVPITVDKSFSQVGGNVQGGFDIRVSPNLGLVLGGIYFFGSDVDCRWTPAPGTYKLKLHPGASLNFLDPLAQSFGNDFTPVRVKTSMFKALAGFRVGF
jgi:outer membrane protein W